MREIVQNEFSKTEENNARFLKRFYIYQNERFPFLGHGLLISAFSFSAVSYSRISRGLEGFIAAKDFWLGTFTAFTIFFLVRVLDEFKDAKEDALYRRELAVPRGLISFKELKWIGITLFALQLIIQGFFLAEMFWLYALVMLYLGLMTFEFFIPNWLKRHQFWYVTSHMFIIPFLDVYTSGLDWNLQGLTPPRVLLFFFAVSYMNGLVLELGRKIRIPEDEQEGVLTYSAKLGPKKAISLWLLTLFITFLISCLAAYHVQFSMEAYVLLGLFFVLSTLPGFMSLARLTKKRAKSIEYASALWTILMYLILGAAPMIKQMFFP